MNNTIKKVANPDDLVFYVKFHLKPEHVDEFKRSLLELVNEMSKEETFVSTFLHQDSTDPYKYTIYERWREPNMDAFFQNQLKGKVYREYYEAHIDEWSATPRDITVLKPMQHWLSSNLEPSDKDLVFYVDFHIKPDKVVEWKEASSHVLNTMASEDTFVNTFLHQNIEDPTKFTLYERWTEPSMEAFMENQHHGKEYRKSYEEIVPELMQNDRAFAVLNPVEHLIK